MRHWKLRLTSLLLAMCLLLTGCSFTEEFIERMSIFGIATAYEDMEYTRPDMAKLQEALDNCSSLAQSTDSVDTLMKAVYAFYDEYDAFYTNSTLAEIRYSCDLTNLYWEEEYNFCSSQSPTAEAAVEQLFCTLAASPLREELEEMDYWGEGFFDAYDTEPSIDEPLLSLMEQETELINRYYGLDDRYTAAGYTLDDALFQDMVSLYIQLIGVRQEIADYLGYPDYPTLAYDMYYARDYTPEEAAAYMTKLGEALYTPYTALSDSDIWEQTYTYCPELETYRFLQTAAKAMGGIVADAFSYMDTNGLHHILYGENKLNTSFETYIWNYYAPFVFMNPYLDQSDKLTFAHEFGHFAADYSCDGTFCGIDIAETHSMAMEYLCLCYGKDTELLTRYKLADSLCTYMEQSAYAMFEYQVYGLQDEDLTEENITELYCQVGKQFGFDAFNWDPREYVTVIHFFTDPMYTVSYVLSNDLAMQIYQLELEDPGAGLSLYENILPSQDTYILTFAETHNLESPFSQERLQSVAAFFQDTPF